MSYTTAALTYGLLLIPAALAMVVIAQGVYKLTKQDQSGKLIIALGIVFLLFVPAAYLLLIRI